MRPVNLIPPDMRRGDNAPLRTGPLAYIVVGALALVLLGVTMLVLVSNEVNEKKDELVTLEREDAAAKTRAEELAPYAQFHAMSEQRVETVTSLADSRFDWPRVMRELALVLPDDVLLTSLTAGASGEEGGEGVAGVQGPSLELSGCTVGQDAVARFVTALKDIDGVTRVGLESSALGEGSGSAGSSGQACESAGYELTYQLVVAFDAAPTPVAVEGEVEPEAEEAEGSEADEGSEGTEEGG
ncbi:MAG TPA: PilN domain-containing protein [Solirubrobacterales bacterium]|nr:PilN domain-containing protein [Solirubrobacterales bacterium]